MRENEQALPPITLRVCDSITCSLFGSDKILSEAAYSLEKDVRVVRSPCMGACDKAPVAAIGHSMIENVTPTSIQEKSPLFETAVFRTIRYRLFALTNISRKAVTNF